MEIYISLGRLLYIVQPVGNYRKLVAFDRSEQEDLNWLIENGFGKNQTDAVRKAVAFARLKLEASR